TGDSLERITVLLERLRASRILLRQDLFTLKEFLLPLQRILVALVELTQFPIKSLFPLGNPPFGVGHFSEFGFLFLLQFYSRLKNEVLGLQLGFFEEILRFTLSRLNHLRRLVLCLR